MYNVIIYIHNNTDYKKIKLRIFMQDVIISTHNNIHCLLYLPFFNIFIDDRFSMINSFAPWNL